MLLETPRLLLRPITEDDTDAIHACESLPEFVRYTSHGVRTREETRARILEVIAQAGADPRLVFDLAVVERAGGRVLGRSGLGRSAAEPRDAAIWYTLHPSVWGRGYAVEATQAVIDFAFGVLGLHRVWADIDPRNLPSVRVAERLCLRREAFHLENFWSRNDGAWTDTLIYALLDREWRERQAGGGPR